MKNRHFLIISTVVAQALSISKLPASTLNDELKDKNALHPYLYSQQLNEEFRKQAQKLSNPSCTKDERYDAGAVIETLAVEGEPCSIKYLWLQRNDNDLAHENNKKAFFVRDFLACDLSLTALGEIGYHINARILSNSTFLSTLDQIIALDEEADLIASKLTLGRGIDYIMCEAASLDQIRQNLRTGWAMLQNFEKSPTSLNTETIERNYIYKAYCYLLEEAIQANDESLIDKLALRTFENAENDHHILNKHKAFYHILSTTYHMERIKERYGITLVKS